MRKLVTGLFILGLTAPLFAQVIQAEQLEEVVLTAVNYKYVTEMGVTNEALPVQTLRRKAANFDIKNSDLYQDDYDMYHVSFYIPDGKMVAAYDKEGKILRTIEKFKNVALPVAVRDAVADRFPGWTLTEDQYKVTYHDQKGVTKKFKIRLENGDKILRVKLDGEGNFQ